MGFNPIQGKQLNINLTGSFSGSFVGNLTGTSSYYAETDPVFTAVSGTFVQTSSFNSFTSSYYADSSSFDTRINDILLNTGSFDSVPIISTVATTTILPRTPVYNNGPSNDGIDAFLSGSTNGVLGSIDGVAVIVGDTILVKNQAAQLQNGVYDIITTGSLSTKYVLRRSILSDETIEFDPQIVIPSFGTTNKGGIFPQTTNNPVVGVSAIVYTQQTNTLISQTTTGTQATYQIPWYTATARQLSKGSNNLKYINVTSGSTVTTSSLVLTGSMILTSGSYSGSGANLFNIPASGIVGLNLSQIASGSVSASISPQNGLQVNTNVTATSFTGSFSGSGANLFNIPASGITGLNLSQISSGSVSASISPDSGVQINTNVTATSFTGSLQGTASYAETASYAPGYLPLTGGVISGNLQVIGTASFAYTTASIVEVGTNTIILSTDYPASRFGGISVIDSGSFGNSSTGSLFWDSLNNKWIYSNPSGSTYDSAMLISGPKNTNGLGNEVGMDTDFVAVGQGSDHIRPGTIYNSGSITQVTGSLTVTEGISGSFSGSGENLYNIPASGITGLNLSQISSGSVSASISPSSGLQVNTNVTATSFTGSLFGTASYSVTASFIDGGYY